MIGWLAMDGPIRLWINANNIVLTMPCHVDAPNNDLRVNMQYGMLIRIGHPYSLTAAWKSCNTVTALLMVARFMKTINRVNPQTPPCITYTGKIETFIIP